MKSKLDRWIVEGNILVGYLYDYRGIPSGARVKTDALVELDLSAGMARCLDGDFRLGEQGTRKEHEAPMIGEG